MGIVEKMSEENKAKKKKIDVNTYRFGSGQTINEILKAQTTWKTDEECLLNMIDSDWRATEDFTTEKEKELGKKILMAANNPETDLKLLAVQSEIATQYLCQKHTNNDLWEKAMFDHHSRPYSKDVVNVQNQINFKYELPEWMKDNLVEIPNNWFQKTPQQLQEEQEKEEIQTTIAVNSITKDIVIEPYSRKPEDIEAMKSFIANVSGINAENITNEQSQAFIDNLGITEEAYLTAKVDGTFEYTNNNTYSPDFYKTSESKEILSIIEDNANHHIIRSAPESEARKNCIKDYEFIHSIKNERMNEKKIDVNELKDALRVSLNENAKPLESIAFTRENYNKLFPESRIKTPLENVKLGEHQFEKLDIKERQNILNAVHETLKTPDIVINEMRKTVFNDEKAANIYAKAFEINGKNKAIQSVVVEIENENVSISTHERDINNVVNKIKMPEQLIYTSEEIGQMIERRTGKQFTTVNPTRVNNEIVSPNKNISQVTENSNQNIEVLKTQLSEKDKELDIWTTKAQKDNEQISLLTNQLETANNTIHQQSLTIQEQKQQIVEQDKLLNGKGSVIVNGVERKFEHGLKHAFPEAVKRIDIENQRNKDLTTAYNELAKLKSKNISPKSPSDDEWNR